MASYSNITNTLDFAVAFNPKTAFPLDARSMFGSYDAAVAAAATAENAGSDTTVYYYGQILTVFADDVAKHYTIQGDKTLKEVGSSTLGDDKSIVLSNNVLSLKNFGVEYYKYVAATETVEAHYELQTGWKEGLSPKVVKNTSNNEYYLAWYEPSTTTVEGLQSTVTTLQEQVTAVEGDVEANATDIAGLKTRMTAAEGEITTFKADQNTTGSIRNIVNEQIAAVLADEPEAFDTLKEIADWCAQHSTEVVEMQNDINTNATAITALQTLVGTIPDTATATDVIGYIAEYVTAAIADLDLGTASKKNAEDFATAAQGALADSAVQTVEAGDNGYIKVDGTAVKVYEDPDTVASTSQLGKVKVDGTSISATAAGVISVEAIDKSKVTGLTTAIDESKTAAVAEAKEYGDDTFVTKTNVVAAADVAESVEAASDTKVVSEKALLSAMEWKTTM